MSKKLYKLPAGSLRPRAFRRAAVKRQYRQSASMSASALIGDLQPGDDLCGLTNGQFSLVDMIEHVLSLTGPADVTVATWTMGIYDARRAQEFVSDKRIRRIRFLVDPSMFSRRPEFSAILVRGFGPESFRPVNIHAKFATVRGAKLAVALRSSMNLNRNDRIESFDISADSEMVAFFEAVVDQAYRLVDAENRKQAHRLFSDLLTAGETKAAADGDLDALTDLGGAFDL